jgi:hypothetical protein
VWSTTTTDLSAPQSVGTNNANIDRDARSVPPTTDATTEPATQP